MAGFSVRYLTISTSPRSPYRIKHYIKLLENFQGEKWNKENQIQYYGDMISNQIGNFTIGNSRTPDFSARDKVNRAPLTFGFVKLKPTIEITEPGRNLLNPYLEKETLTRQLLKFQLPSPLMPEKTENEGYFNIKPFLELLRLIRTVGALTRSEFKAVGITMTDYHHFEQKIEELHNYRAQKEQSTYPSKKFHADYMFSYVKNLYRDILESGDISLRESQNVSESKFIKTKINNINDYADSYLRYLIGTELISINRQRKIIIAPDKMDEVDFILETINREAISYTKSEYENLLFNTIEPKLLTDDVETLQTKISDIDTKLEVVDDAESVLEYQVQDPIISLKYEYSLKNEKLKKQSMNERALELKAGTEADIENILETFKGIKAKDYFDNPLFLEWNCWRAITMINNGDIKGQFKVNTEGDPIGTAGGNTADIVGNYGNFNMICEVTLSGGAKQYEMENESVMRHLGNLRRSSEMDTFGLFVAPKIHESLVVEFYYKHRIPTALYGGTIEFIPLSIDEFSDFFKYAMNREIRLTENDIKSIHEKSKEIAENAENENDWLTRIKEFMFSI